MKISFNCPTCEQPSEIRLPGPRSWQCPACDQLLDLPDTPQGAPLSDCLVCGNTELYRKKDFPHWLGLTILTVACLAFLIANLIYHQWWGWAVLIGSAVFDGLLYLCVGDVIVCYRCNAHYRGPGLNPEHRPFELGIAERYRQERLRREQLQAERKSPER